MLKNRKKGERNGGQHEAYVSLKGVFWGHFSCVGKVALWWKMCCGAVQDGIKRENDTIILILKVQWKMIIQFQMYVYGNPNGPSRQGNAMLRLSCTPVRCTLQWPIMWGREQDWADPDNHTWRLTLNITSVASTIQWQGWYYWIWQKYIWNSYLYYNGFVSAREPPNVGAYQNKNHKFSINGKQLAYGSSWYSSLSCFVHWSNTSIIVMHSTDKNNRLTRLYHVDHYSGFSWISNKIIIWRDQLYLLRVCRPHHVYISFV